MSESRCECSSACLQIEGCQCGFKAAREVRVRVSGFVDIKIDAKTDLALSDSERMMFVNGLLRAGEILSDKLKEMRAENG